MRTLILVIAMSTLSIVVYAFLPPDAAVTWAPERSAHWTSQPTAPHWHGAIARAWRDDCF